ncbi:MAG TPA: DUF177 domain-containing protein [Bacteroidales bacterium]|nr:DUF177 domain-containing protein [Bacteroidales bacterium]
MNISQDFILLQPEIRRIVKQRDEYIVRFSELAEATETFDYALNNKFFQVFDNADWKGGSVAVKAVVDKRPDGLTITLYMKGLIDVMCDRCLDYYSQEIMVDQTIFLKYGDHEEELDDNLIMVSKESNQFDLGQLIYEYLALNLPVQKKHPDKSNGKPGCNQEMLKKLDNHMTRDNKSGTDPRWDDLKKIFNNN